MTFRDCEDRDPYFKRMQAQIVPHNNEPKQKPIEMLAARLLLISAGDTTSPHVIFSHMTDLPKKFDPKNPPHPIQPESPEAKALHSFYNLNSGRECKVTSCPVRFNTFLSALVSLMIPSHNR